MITFDELAMLEPQLFVLLEDVKKEGNPTDMMSCWFTRWYGTPDAGGYKSRLVKLVGYISEIDNPILRSRAAYDVAYQTLLRRLPGCESCEMFDCPDNFRERR